MNIAFFDIVRYTGIINSVFLGIRLHRSKNNKANIYLALLLYLLSFNLLFINNLDPIFVENNPWIIILIDWLPFAYAPLIYLYIFNSLIITPKISFKITWRHFIMSIINSLYLMTLYLIIGKVGFSNMVKSILGGNYPWFFYLSMVIKILFAVAYLIKILLLLKEKNEIIKLSSGNRSRRNWFLLLIIGFIFCYLSPVLDIIFQLDLMYESLAVIFFVIWIYIIVYNAIQHPNIFQNPQIINKIREGIYSTDLQKEKLQRKIEEQFDKNKIHLIMNLKLQDLADKLNEPLNKMSFYINDIFKVNFNELVNQYRLKEFLNLVESRSLKNFTILDLAMDSGFSSKTSFNRVFKDFFHQTPSQYIKNRKN